MEGKQKMNCFSICPKTGRIIGLNLKSWWVRSFLPITGMFALAWFLFRVVPKPSRISYPCQQVAGSMIGSLSAFFSACLGSAVFLRKISPFFKKYRVALGWFFALAGLTTGLGIATFSACSQSSIPTAPTDIKVARTGSWVSDPYSDKTVVRVYDPTMSNFTIGVTPYDYYWRNYDLAKMQGMLETAILQITNAGSVSEAWLMILPGMSSSSKIAVKVNHNDVGFYPNDWYKSNNTSPAMMIALTKSLKKAGIQEANITFFDRSRNFPAAMKSDVRAQCPNVVMLGSGDGMAASTTKFTFTDYSCPYYIPQALLSADYFIDCFLCKAHSGGITGSMKNLGGLCQDPGNVLHNGHEYSGSRVLPDLVAMPAVRNRFRLAISEATFLCQQPTEYLSSSKANNTNFFPGGMPNSLIVSRSPFMIDNVMEDFMSVEKNGSPTSHTGAIQWLRNCVGKYTNWVNAAIDAGTIVNRGGDMPPKDLAYDPNLIEFISVRNSPQVYTLTTSAAAGGSVSNNPTGTSFPLGTVVTLTATPSSGYSFSGWLGDATGLMNPLTVTMNSNKTFFANFRLGPLPRYSLTLTAASGGAVAANPNQTLFDSSSTVILTATPNAGYVFTGWTGDYTGTINPATVSMKANKNITANFVFSVSTWASDCAWTQVANGWGPVEKDKSNSEAVAGDGKTITLNGATYTKGFGCHAVSEITIPLNKSYSSFTSDIGVDDEVGANGSVVFQVVVDGVTKYTSPTMTGKSTTLTVTVDVTNATTLSLKVGNGGDNVNSDHADWAGAKLITSAPVPTYSLTTSATNGTIALNPAGGTYNSGTVVTLTATSSAGYAFSGWSGDLTGATNPATITMNANKSVTATFTAVPQYTLTTSSTNGTIALNPGGGTYNSGTVITLTASPAAGYAFSSWSGDLTGTANPATVTMNANKSVTANFTLKPTTITFEAENLTITASAAGSVKVTGATGASNNSYVQFNGTAVVGDWLEFTLPNLSAATYNIKMYFKSNNNRCICQGSVDGVNLGATCDEYQAAAVFQVMFNMGNKALTAGNHAIRFTVTAKNTASSGYAMTIDKVVLSSQ